MRNKNLLTLDTLSLVATKIKQYNKNNGVSAVMFSSVIDRSTVDTNMFSIG